MTGRAGVTGRTDVDGRLTVPASRLRAVDAIRLGLLGVRGRPLRAALSGLGIALGVASVVGVLGLSASSSAGLLREIDQLGTNLLRVAAVDNLTGDPAELPRSAAASIARLPGVQSVAWTANLTGDVYRSTLVPRTDTLAINLRAADVSLPSTLSVRMLDGRWLDATTSSSSAIVLGATSAQRLGIDRVAGQVIDVSGTPMVVIGILTPSTLAPELDEAAFVGAQSARRLFGWSGRPSMIYERSTDETVSQVRGLAAAAADPERPQSVAVSRPSDALVAKASARNAFTGLFLALGGVALLIGGVGVANVMVIGVLERRGEIGLRRALGARRRHVAVQFALEALVLSALGGIAGAGLGAGATVGYAWLRGWEAVLPASVLVAAAGASLVVGAVAGLYPAIRAAALSPTEALGTL